MQNLKDVENIPEIEEGLETEQITEEQTEMVNNIDYSDYFEDISEQLQIIRESLEEQETEQETEQAAENSSVSSGTVPGSGSSTGLEILGSGSGDFNLYLSDKVDNASINDLYSMAVSIRNILLLFFLFWSFYKLIGIFKNLLYKVMNK